MLDAILSGYVQRRKVEFDQIVATAWWIEKIARSNPKRLPSLAHFLGRNEPPKAAEPQTNDQVLAAMRSWAAITRGEKPS